MANRVTKSFRRIFSIAAMAVAKKYLQKDRSYSYNGLHLKVLKDVFHPGLFRSTKVFADWLDQQDLSGKKVLEIGSGSGLISLTAARKGAYVTAVDVNPKAVANTSMNAKHNGLAIEVYQSDLFDNVADAGFDWILINPPYYPKEPANDYEKAWYCGEEFDYFKKLFFQLKQRGDAESCYMILSDSCDLDRIHAIAKQNGLLLEIVQAKTVAGEQLTIYRSKSAPLTV